MTNRPPWPIIILLIVCLLCCILTPVLVMAQFSACADKGGRWTPTNGFNGLCISPDGRILP